MNSIKMLFLIAACCLANFASAADQPDAVYTIPVLEIRYFPLTADQSRLDKTITSNIDLSLPDIRKKCDRMTRQAAEALTEGSRFRSYNNAAAKPSLYYKVVETIEHLEALPINPKKTDKPDYI